MRKKNLYEEDKLKTDVILRQLVIASLANKCIRKSAATATTAAYTLKHHYNLNISDNKIIIIGR